MDFAAPSSTLDRYRPGSSRCSQVSVAWSWQSPDLAVGDRTGLSTGAPRLAARCPGTIDPRGLGLPFRAARGLRDPSPVHTRRHGTVGPPLLASSASPLRRFPSVRLLPVNQLPKQRISPSGQGFHPPTSCSVRVVSHHLDGFLRTGAAGLLRPATGPGVRRVSDDSSLRSLRAEARNTAGV